MAAVTAMGKVEQGSQGEKTYKAMNEAAEKGTAEMQPRKITRSQAIMGEMKGQTGQQEVTGEAVRWIWMKLHKADSK